MLTRQSIVNVTARSKVKKIDLNESMKTKLNILQNSESKLKSEANEILISCHKYMEIIIVQTEQLHFILIFIM